MQTITCQGLGRRRKPRWSAIMIYTDNIHNENSDDDDDGTNTTITHSHCLYQLAVESMSNIADYYVLLHNHHNHHLHHHHHHIIFIDLKMTMPNIADFYDSRITKKENDKTLV